MLEAVACHLRSKGVGGDASLAFFVGLDVQNSCLLRLEVVDIFRIYRSGGFQSRFVELYSFSPYHKSEILCNIFFRPTEFSVFRFDGDLLTTGLCPVTLLTFGKQCWNRKVTAEIVAD